VNRQKYHFSGSSAIAVQQHIICAAAQTSLRQLIIAQAHHLRANGAHSVRISSPAPPFLLTKTRLAIIIM
jgi:hypothetical protein